MKINNIPVNNDEFEQLIDIISGKSFKKYFQKYPREFTKMRKGFRSETITDEMAIQLAKKNLENPFIITYVEKNVKKWLEEIEEYKQGLLERGASDAGALFMTLQQSMFADNLDIYFKISESNYSKLFIEEMKNAIESYGVPFEILSKVSQGNSSAYIEKKLEETEEELSETKQELDRAKEELERIEKEKEELGKKLDELDIQNKRLSTRLTELEVLSNYDDVQMVEHTEDFPYLSVCRVYQDYNGQLWLSRLADINEKREIVRFRKIDWKPPYFENRDRLYHKDGKSQEGDIGVWKWNAVQNKTNPESDYVTTAFCSEITLTQYIIVPDVTSIKELCDLLLTGVSISKTLSKVFFAYRMEDDCYEGVLCHERDFVVVNGLVRLRRDVVVLPQYRITGDSVLRIEGMDLVACVGMGVPDSLYKTIDPYTVVKEVLLSRLTISYLRNSGLSRKDAQAYQQYIRSIISKDIYEEMAEKYSCSVDDAQYFVNKFVEVSEKYLRIDEIEIDIFAQAIERLPNTIESAKRILKEEWEYENSGLIKQKTIEVQDLSDQVEEKKKELLELSKDLSRVSSEILVKEKLAVSVEQEVKERIENAQESLAKLVVDASLISSALNFKGSEEVTLKSDASEGFPVLVASEFSEDEIEEVTIFEDELADNLIKIGYSKDGAIDIAHISSFCISERLPVICSSNSLIIASSIAATLGEGMFLVLDVPVDRYMNVSKIIESERSKYKVIVIQGAFDSFGASIFNSVMSKMFAWTETSLLMFAIDGVTSKDIPVSVWNRSFYIDGDVDFVGTTKNVLNSFNCTVSFERAYETGDFRKILKGFNSFVDNEAASHYAKFLKSTNETAEKSVPFLSQVAIWANVNGSMNLFKEKIDEENVASKVLDRIRSISRS